MRRPGLVEPGLQQAERQAGHQHADLASAEMAVAPQKRQQRLGDADALDLRGQQPREAAGDALAAGEFGLSPRRTLRRRPPHRQRPHQCLERRRADPGETVGLPFVARQAPAAAVERQTENIVRPPRKRRHTPAAPASSRRADRRCGDRSGRARRRGSWRKQEVSPQVAQVFATRRGSEISPVRALFPGAGSAASPGEVETDDQRVTFDPRPDHQVPARPETKVDVVPRHRRVAAERRRRADHDARMRVPLDDVAAGLQGRLVQRVRQLAQPAADRRHQAPLLQHAADDIAAPAAGAPDLAPEAEDLARRHDDAVERRRRPAANSAPCPADTTARPAARPTTSVCATARRRTKTRYRWLSGSAADPAARLRRPRAA